MPDFKIVRYHEKINTADIITHISDIQCGEFGATLTQEYIAALENIIPYFLNGKSVPDFWVALHEERVVGSIGLKKINKDVAEIKRFFIHKDFRGKGISHALMDIALAEGKKDQKKNLYLGTAFTRERAVAFYIKKGFQEVAQKDLPPDYTPDPMDSCFFKIGVG